MNMKRRRKKERRNGRDGWWGHGYKQCWVNLFDLIQSRLRNSSRDKEGRESERCERERGVGGRMNQPIIIICCLWLFHPPSILLDLSCEGCCSRNLFLGETKSMWKMTQEGSLDGIYCIADKTRVFQAKQSKSVRAVVGVKEVVIIIVIIIIIIMILRPLFLLLLLLMLIMITHSPTHTKKHVDAIPFLSRESGSTPRQ